MTNLPPEHRGQPPEEEPNSETTGSFPGTEADQYLRPPSTGPADLVPPLPTPPEPTGVNTPPQPGHRTPPEPPRHGAQQPPLPPSYQQEEPQGYTPDGFAENPPSPRHRPAFGEQPPPEPNAAPFGEQFAARESDGSFGQDVASQSERFYSDPPARNTAQVDGVGAAPLGSPAETFESTMQSSVAFPAEPEVWNEPVNEPPSPADAGLADIASGAAHPAPVFVNPAEGDSDIGDLDADLPARVRRKLSNETQPDTRLQRLHTERDSESGWSYLVGLGVLFCLLLLFSWGCGRLSNADQSAARNPLLASELNVVLLVNGDQVVVSGTLPDENRAVELVALVAEHYDSQTQITNNLRVDSALSVDDSVILLTGRAAPGDTRPADLQTTLDNRFEIDVASNTVEFGALDEDLVSVSVVIAGDSVTLQGAVPDQARIDLLVAAAQSVWGEDNVESSGLVLGSAVWEGGQIVVSGNVLGSVEPGQFAEQVRVDGVFVDVGESATDIANASPDELKAAIAQRVEATPIVFGTGESSISDENLRTLDSLATLLLALPEDEIDNATIVGFGDGGAGSAALGKSRADIVFTTLSVENPALIGLRVDGVDGTSNSEILIRFG